MNRVSRNRRIDRPALFLQPTRDDREVRLLHRARGKLARKLAVGLVIFRHHQATARFFVQTMDNAGTLLAADAGKRLAMTEERIHEGVFLIAHGVRWKPSPSRRSH